MAIDARTYSADGILRDGSSVRIRAVRPTDKALLREAITAGYDPSYQETVA